MATIDTAAVWRVRNPIALAALVSITVLGLGGCASDSRLFGSAGQNGPALAEQAPPPQAAPVAAAKVTIAPVIGAPDAVAKQLHSQLAAAAQRQHVVLTSSPSDKADYTLRGYVVAARDKAGTKVSYIWDVTDGAGKRVNRITGEEIAPGTTGKDPWSAMTPQISQSIAEKTATSLATWLPTQAPAKGVPMASAAGAASDQPAAARPADATAVEGPTPGSIGGGVTAAVPTVSGAPGDGSTALTSAIQRELTKSGVQLADAGASGSYKVEGKVVVGEGKDGKQAVQIDWLVRDPKGKKLGTVSQKNDVPQGSLDGAWGKTADLAASAAAQGILRLLPSQKTN